MIASISPVAYVRRHERIASMHEARNDSAMCSGTMPVQPTLKEEEPEKTIFYLAYGSNLSAETFLGMRGIRPLSQQNVHCPTLTLTFDLPGVPYVEPCFANTRFSNPKDAPSRLAALRSTPQSAGTTDYHKTRWTKGLVGVVYEVTIEDFAKIIATEGGGNGYHDIKVPCHLLPKDTDIVPPTPTGEPFIAHTLYCPPRGGILTRPDPNYAQASPRYMNLITDGASQHNLPSEYREYLAGIRPYRATTWRQKAGKALFIATWMPAFMTMLTLAKMVADKDGRTPKWHARIMDLLFKGVWWSYDGIYRRVYGDGERTIEDMDDDLPIEKSREVVSDTEETEETPLLELADEKLTKTAVTETEVLA